MIGFEKFLFQEDADYLHQLLHQNGIESALELPVTEFDAIVGHNRDNEYFIIKIAFKDFVLALQAIENDLKGKGIPTDYHLREMDTNELMEILEHPDQWSRFDGAAAKILLENKGIMLTDKKIKIMAAVRQDQLTRQRTISHSSYFILVLISIFGWIFPIVGGLMIYCLKQTNTDGKKRPFFSEGARIQGLVLAFIGVLSTIGWYIATR